MRKFLEITASGLDLLRLHPLRSAVTVACVVAVLTPFLTGLGIAHGIRGQAETAIREGADVYVTGLRFGRPAPLPLTVIESVRVLDGVQSVTPRIVGEIVLGKDRIRAVLVGIDPNELSASTRCIRGRMFTESNAPELIVGSDLAHRLALDVDARIPPFYRSSRGERVSTVVGVFESDVSLWQANLVLTSFKSAAEIFDQPGFATELLVRCRPGYERNIATAVSQLNITATPDDLQGVTLRATTRDEVNAILPAGMFHVEGVFNLHFLLAFAVGIPLVLVASGVGLSERRREIGILKALGWQTDEVLLRGFVESLLLTLAAASIAVLLSFGWLRGLNGLGVAGIFLAGVEFAPAFAVPFRLLPTPVFLTFLVALSLVLTGTLYSAWRAAVSPPAAAMR